MKILFLNKKEIFMTFYLDGIVKCLLKDYKRSKEVIHTRRNVGHVIKKRRERWDHIARLCIINSLRHVLERNIRKNMLYSLLFHILLSIFLNNFVSSHTFCFKRFFDVKLTCLCILFDNQSCCLWIKMKTSCCPHNRVAFLIG